MRPNSYFLGRNSAAHSRSSDMPRFLLWGARLLKTLNIKGRIGFSKRVAEILKKNRKENLLLSSSIFCRTLLRPETRFLSASTHHHNHQPLVCENVEGSRFWAVPLGGKIRQRQYGGARNSAALGVRYENSVLYFN